LHGGPASTSNPKIDIALEIDAVCIRLTVSDDGRPFDVSKTAPEKISKPLSELEPGGLGLLLVKHYAQTLTYERTAEGLNIVTVEIRRLNADSPGQGVPKEIMSSTESRASEQGILQLFDTDILKGLVEAIAPISLNPGDVPIRQGEVSETAFLLTSG